MVNVSNRTLEGYISGLGTKVDVTSGIVDRTSLDGMSPQAVAELRSAIMAAQAAGLSQIVITAGKGGGHLSHSSGTEFDIKGINPDGSLWTNAQRVAVARGAQAAGADRFGLYNMAEGLGKGTLHFGNSGKGRPAAVWGAGSAVRGEGARKFKDPAERQFLQDFMGGSKKANVMSKAEYRQALAALGYTGASAVKQFQRDAGLKTDGIVGKDTTRALRAAIDQGTTFANGQGTPVPGIPLPRERPQAAPTVSASDKARAYGAQQPMAAPVMPVQRADLAAPAPNYDPLSSMQAPQYAPDQAVAPGAPAYDPLSSVSAPRASVAPLAPPQIATGSPPGIGSDPDRNFTSPYDPQFGPSLNASILATRVNQDYQDLRNGYPATNGTGARLPPAQGAEVMGGNSALGAGYFDGYAPPPNFSSRISSYDPLSSIQSVSPQTPAAPISPASFDDRWNAVMDLPARPSTPDALPYSSGSQATSSWDAPYNGPDVGYQDAPVYTPPSPSTATGTARVPTTRQPSTSPTPPVLTYTQPRVAQTSKVSTETARQPVNGTPTPNPPTYDPLSSVQVPAAAPQAAYDPLSSVQAPLPAPEAATVGPAPLGDLTPLQPAKPRAVSSTPKRADQKQQEADPWAATPKLFRPAFGLGVAGSMVGGLTLGPLGALLGRVAGNQIGKHLSPTQLPTPTNYIGSGLGAIEAIRSGAAPAGSFAVARNNANGFVTRWSNVGPQNSPVQTTYTPSGNSYSTYSIGPSLSPMQVTVFHGPDQQSSNGGGSGGGAVDTNGSISYSGTGGLY